MGDGAIDGVVNVYVIDDDTRDPIVGAAVRVGELDGTTDADGLFVANGVVGPQTVIVTAASYRAEMWVGADAANMTFDLEASVLPTPPASTLSGQITGFSGISVASGHAKQAAIWYSDVDDLGDPANSIKTPSDANICVGTGSMGCTFSVKTRSGQVALIAAIWDRDLNGTPLNPDDDTVTLIGWASRGGITVVGGVDQMNQDLAMISASSLVTETVDFGTPPSSLPDRAALIGIDLGDDGVFQLPLFRSPTDAALLVPTIAAVSGTGYRLSAFSADNSLDPKPQSIVLRRDLTGTALSSGTWLEPPTNVSVTRADASWTPSAGATLQTVEYAQDDTRLFNVSVFDATTSVTTPDLISLPSGQLQVKVNAIGAPGLDLTSFSLDADRDKLSEVGQVPINVN